MKVIDLLNKKANGEELPNKIKYYGYVFEYDTNHLRYETYYDGQIFTLQDFVNVNDSLNDEVEIIEDTPKEDKKIEKIKFTNGGLTLHKVVDEIENDYPVGEVERTIIFKLNEIIDKINKDTN